MGDSNVKKTVRNSSVSFFFQVVSFLLIFVNRKVFIHFLDIEYLGYQSLFGNVFTLLSVAELGIGEAISYQLYKEIAAKNEDAIGMLMHVYKIAYSIIAVLILFLGLGCYFFLPVIVKDYSLPWESISVIYFLQLLGIVLGYLLSYRRLLFIASQKEYKCVIVDFIVSFVMQVLQLFFLWLTRNFFVYFAINLSTSLIQNIILYFYSQKEFPFLRGKYHLSKDFIKSRNITQDIKNMIIHKLSYAVYDGTDNVVISTFLGIRFVALYGNYRTLHSGVVSLFVRKLLHPIRATLGNTIYSGSNKEQLWTKFQMFDVFSFFFSTQIALGFFVFYQPVIEIWLGKEYLLPFAFVVVYSVTIYLGVVWEIVYLYRSVFGDYKQDRWYMVASAVLNIVISIIGVRFWGIVGIQIGTLVAFIPIAYSRIRFVVKSFFNQSVGRFLYKHFLLFLLFIVECLCLYFTTNRLSVTISGLFLRAVLWVLIPVVLNTLVYFRNASFKLMVEYLFRSTKVIFKRNS